MVQFLLSPLKPSFLSPLQSKTAHVHVGWFVLDPRLAMLCFAAFQYSLHFHQSDPMTIHYRVAFHEAQQPFFLRELVVPITLFLTIIFLKIGKFNLEQLYTLPFPRFDLELPESSSVYFLNHAVIGKSFATFTRLIFVLSKGLWLS